MQAPTIESEEARDIPLRGLLGLAILLSIAPAIAAQSGNLQPNWFTQCLIVAIPQWLWCALEYRLQPRVFSLAKYQPCSLSIAQGLVALTAVLLAMWAAATESYRPSPVQNIAAVLLIASGISLRLAAIRDLGDGFRDGISPAVGRGLETGGIYRDMRHPSELGLLLILGGTAWIAASPSSGAVVVLVSLPLAILRIRREDQLLAETFGEAARKYQHRTRAWNPRPLLNRPLRAARKYCRTLRHNLLRPIDGLIAISLASTALWWLEVMARGWDGLVWIGYFHLALPAGMMLFLAWLNRHCGIRSSTKRSTYLATIGGFSVAAYGVTKLAIYGYWAPLWSSLLFPPEIPQALRWLFLHSVFFVFPLVPITFWLVSRIFGIRFRRIGLLAGLGCYGLAIPVAILMLELVDHPGHSDLIHTLKTGFCIPLLMLGLGLPFIFRYKDMEASPTPVLTKGAKLP